MHLALTLLAIAATVVVVAGLSSRFRLPAPLVLLLVGVIGSYLPSIPEPTLSSDVVLVGLLPPLLYSAAIRSSLVDFRENRATIGALSVGLVLFTALGVGLVTWWLLPVPFLVAFALGAIVAPPDAVAATAVARQIGLPRRMVTVLEGESMLNDATALVSLRTAIAAFGAAGAVTFWSVTEDAARAVIGGLVIGLAVAFVIGKVRRYVTDPTLDTAMSFLTPFLAYLPAEEAHASGVLSVVVAGLLLGHKSPILQTASSRLSERINWASIQFLLENAVFLMIGLQMRRLVQAAGSSPLGWGRISLACAAVLLAVLVLRPIGVLGFRSTSGLFHGPSLAGPWQHSLVVGWAGMRGVVTLAAAFILPDNTPHREVLVLIAMVVAVGTILIQGLSLPWVARRLRVRGPDPREDALQEATVLQRAVDAGLSALEAEPEADLRTVDTLRDRARDRVNRVWERLGPTGEELETPSDSYRRLRLVMLDAERTELLRLRDSGAADQEVLSSVMASLDVEESMLERIEDRERTLRDAPLLPPEIPGGGCEHLQSAVCALVPQDTRACQECIREGLTWVHLRLCLSCGSVGCCDSSIGNHASKHYTTSGHPVMRSFEPGEAWRWCFVDQLLG